jgi:uncharacterized membrane protein
MEAFSDGVFSIAATLLVLEIALHPPGTPLHQLLEAWPAYLGYLISFLTIGGAWLVHGAMTDRLTRADSFLLRINLLLLLVVAFLPFPTKLVADALHEPDAERVFVTLYGATLLMIRLLGFALDAYARRERLYKPGEEDMELQSERRQLLPIVIAYLTAIGLGLVWPGVAVALYFALALYLVVPFGEVRRLLTSRS